MVLNESRTAGQGREHICKMLLQCDNSLSLCEMVINWRETGMVEVGTFGPNSSLSFTRLTREVVSVNITIHTLHLHPPCFQHRPHLQHSCPGVCAILLCSEAVLVTCVWSKNMDKTFIKHFNHNTTTSLR